jgi:hypothetical protein
MGVEDGILKINTIFNTYGRILKYEQQATLIKLRKNLEWLKNTITIINTTQGNPNIAKKWSANSIYEIIKELNAISS